MTSLLSRLTFVFDSSPTELVCLRSFIPSDWELIEVLRSSTRSEPIYCHKPLEQYVDTQRANATLFICGLGDSRGFYCNDTISLDKKCICRLDWWHTERDYRTYVFAFTCCSAEYLRNRQVAQNFKVALGFADDVLMDFYERDADSVCFWRRFFKRLRSIISSSGRIDGVVFSQIKELYLSALGASPSSSGRRAKWNGPKPTILNAIFLYGQLDSLRQIEGRKV